MARAVAAALGYRHIDSGAMYRAVGWKALRERIPLDDEEAVARVAETPLEISPARVAIGGHDVTRDIRTPEIDRAATSVARLPRVRTVLVARLREMGARGEIVMEGRDIGTVVFPNADVKVYLDAAPEERARLRASDPAHTGGPVAVADVGTLLAERDRIDSTRSASPLYAAPDAIVVNTTGMGVDEVVRDVLRIVREKGLAARG